MKTTVDLPAGVLRQAEEQAAQQGVDLNQFLAAAIVNEVSRGANGRPPHANRRVELPLIKSKNKGPLTIPDDITAKLDIQEDLQRHAASLRR